MAIPRRMQRGLAGAFLIFAFVLQATIGVLAGTTGAIAGTVIDASTNSPVAGARVTASSPSQSVTTTSDAAGRYTFLSLSPDTYTVSVAATSKYDVVTLAGVTVTADQSQTVTLTQQQKLKVIGSVTSRANSSLVKPGTTADVYSISSAQQDKVASVGGGGNLNSAWSAISTVPGVYIAPNQSGYIGSGSTISIRGGDYDQIGYEVDGVPVNRAFDNYPSGALSSLGQQELQVYTGANPANSEAQGISGYINQVIRSGTYPGFKTVDLAAGGPTFYNKFAFEAGGASPNRNVSYYVGAGGYNQSFRYADNFNGASLKQLGGIPLQPCDSTQVAGSAYAAAAPECFSPAGINYTNGGLTPAYVLGPYDLGFTSGIRDRDTIVNVHFGLPRKDGSRDDLQLLVDLNHIGTSFYSSTNDQGGLGYTDTIAGGTGAPFASAPSYPDGLEYLGPTGSLFAPGAALGAPIVNYFYPQSPAGRSLGALIDPDRRDGIANDQSIVKLQYQRNFGSTAFLRVYGYTYYSDWLQIGPQSADFNYIGPSSPDYELSSHTRGVSATFSDQLTDKHLLSIQGNYTTSRSLRDNNTQIFNAGAGPGKRSVFAALVDPTNPYSGMCWGPGAAPGPYVPVSCGGFSGTGGTFISLNQAASGTYGPPAGTVCGGGPCQYLVVGNGQYATYNTVKPKFSAFSITDNWKPTDKLTLNLGLRYDRFEFVGSDTTNTAARSFWYNAFNLDNCIDAGGGLHDKAPTAACPAGTSPIAVTNPSGNVTESYSSLQPRFGATFTVDPRTVLRASYGRYVEAPNSAFQQYDTLQADAPFTLYTTYNFQRFGFTTPNHSVRPPVSSNYDISFEHQFRGDVSVKLTPFLRKTQDQIQQFFLDQKTGFVSGLNVGKQTSAGFELAIDKGDFAREGLAGRLSFAYTNSYINYTKLPNGSTIVDPLNAGIQGYNAYTSFCAANPGDAKCGKTQTAAGAAPCYTTAGAADAACAAGSIANPYWNAPVQGLLDPNARYPTFDTFPGGIGSSYNAYGSPYVLTAIVQYKHGPLAIAPALQFVAGQRFGAPLTTPGVAPDTCAATVAGTTAGDARYGYGAPGGGAYDANGCGTISIPNQYTNAFDGIGAFRSPSQILLHGQITYDVNKRTQVVANLGNIVNRCFGGTKTSFNTSGACGYGIISASGLAPVGNVFNPGQPLQPYTSKPYQATYANYPFNLYLEARLKL